MSAVVLNMKFVMTDIQFAPLNSILLFILIILLRISCQPNIQINILLDGIWWLFGVLSKQYLFTV